MNIDPYLINPIHRYISVTVVGAGGTGSLLLSVLARFNAALETLRSVYLHVKVIDFDTVSEHNVARQLFSPSDVGYKKATVLVERFNRFYKTNWVAVTKPIQRAPLHEVLSNIIITCTDNPESRHYVNELMKDYKAETDHGIMPLYWINTGNNKMTGHVLMGSPKHNIPTAADMFDLFAMNERDKTASCSLAESLEQQHIMINSTIANLCGTLLWDVLTKEEVNYRGMFVNLDTFNIKKIKA